MLRQAARIGGWTLFWTLYQWWAVIGWPSDSHVVSAGVAGTGVLSLVAAAVLSDVRSARGPSASVVPLRRRADVGEEHLDRDLAA